MSAFFETIIQKNGHKSVFSAIIQKVKKNDCFEAEVLDLTYEGLGLVKRDNFPFFVENALPGECVRVRVTKVGARFGYARVEEFLTVSEYRIHGANLNYLRTGIADLAHLAYSQQLAFKRRQIETILSKTAELKHFPIAAVLEASETSRYRNKAQIPVREVCGELSTGFFRKNSHQLVPMEDFYIQAPEIDTVVRFLRDQLRAAGLTAYDERTHTGLVRNIVVRRGYHSGEMMVVFVLTADKLPDRILSALTEQFPAITSVQINVNTSKNNAIFSSTFKTLAGQDTITDNLLEKTFKISAQSFYQVNTAQAEKLYQIAYDFADLRPTDTLIDAYAGIGTIGICAAAQVARVYGMDVVSQAVENAKVNAALNQLDNVHYEVGTAENILPYWLSQGIKPDLIFVDPPRKGLDETFIQAAVAASPRRILYISCNPATFARDTKIFAGRGYQLEKVQPVDLFPQTHHIELVGVFSHA